MPHENKFTTPLNLPNSQFGHARICNTYIFRRNITVMKDKEMELTFNVTGAYSVLATLHWVANKRSSKNYICFIKSISNPLEEKRNEMK